MTEQRVRRGVGGRRESGRGARGAGSASDPHAVAPVLDRVAEARGAPLAARESQGRRRREATPRRAVVAGRADPLRVLRVVGQRRAPVHVRRLPLGRDGGRRVDGWRFRPPKDAGYAEGRVLGVAGRPQGGFAHVEAERVVVVQTATGFPVFLLPEEKLGRRRAAPRPLQLEILLGHDRHLDLRFAGHDWRVERIAGGRGCVELRVHDDARAVTSRPAAEHESGVVPLHWRPVPSEGRHDHGRRRRRRCDGWWATQSIRHAERLEARLASHIRRGCFWRGASGGRDAVNAIASASGHVASPPTAGGRRGGSVGRATFVSDTLDDRMTRRRDTWRAHPFESHPLSEPPSRPSTASLIHHHLFRLYFYARVCVRERVCHASVSLPARKCACVRVCVHSSSSCSYHRRSPP